ncbi:DUF2256 domain-containing protein [Spongiibacter sp.]|uniref:DUF2256 domain-containing protein n=1 Tax=Spongiibacter sp. TaxID=2024860 RepID=UPI000C38E0EB|nr:DUF2256 domain-containing protein [Spongiibacter sp.]MBU73633.1 hypothetical protein [Spongiibacter sp.]
MVHHKTQLPSKICPACQRPFNWRRKWKHQWDEIRYCSQHCRQARRVHSEK